MNGERIKKEGGKRKERTIQEEQKESLREERKK